MTATALRFQVGARTLAVIPRRLARVSVNLEDALTGELPVLPPLGMADGWVVTSLPATAAGTLGYLHPAAVPQVRQRYTRYYADLTMGWEAYTAGLSSATRSALKRKAKKIAQANGGELNVRRYRTAAEVADFLPLARQVSATTYQERLLDAGLPADDQFRSEALDRAAADTIRGWLLFLGDAPIAYLCCLAERDTLLYSYVGHHPGHSALSPGSVLMAEAMRDLQGDRFYRFDFTEGEGQHKRQFATGGVACVDLLLLRRTVANCAALAALAAFDTSVAVTKRAVTRLSLGSAAKRLTR